MSNSFHSAKVTELPPVWEELLTRLIICNSVVCYDMFVRLSLGNFGWALDSDSSSWKFGMGFGF